MGVSYSVMSKRPDISIEDVVLRDGRYPLAAVQFIREGLNLTVQRVHGNSTSQEPRHVSGAQLCEGLQELALRRWGRMARYVLKRWHIHSTRDFGEVVFLLVNSGWMRRESQDCLEDFDEVYDFATMFERHYDFEGHTED